MPGKPIFRISTQSGAEWSKSLPIVARPSLRICATFARSPGKYLSSTSAAWLQRMALIGRRCRSHAETAGKPSYFEKPIATLSTRKSKHRAETSYQSSLPAFQPDSFAIFTTPARSASLSRPVFGSARFVRHFHLR